MVASMRIAGVSRELCGVPDAHVLSEVGPKQAVRLTHVHA
ncbi:hypothetical protein R54767_01075 [Paraburkholderia gardini]|uniref:Transposase IS66 family protein n=1 Tax=Paraburkholderia gardini TaxID=2823469 RepID=A0ABN7QHQ4_9BURK|nr:hypothetical protein R54767_01075 [Paraburkholderia gardini]